MQQKKDPLEALAAELGEIAGRIDREATLRIDALLSDMRRIDAERELRFSNLERLITDRLATVKDGRDGVDGAPGERGADGASVSVEDFAPVIASEVARAISASPARDGRDGVDGKDADMAAVTRLVEDRVAAAVAAIPPARDGEDGQSVTIDDVRPLIDQGIATAVAAIPPARDGMDADMEALRQEIRETVAVEIRAIPVPQNGKDADQEAILASVMSAAREQVAALPVPQDGKSVTTEDVAPMIKAAVTVAVGEAVAAIPAPKDGRDGKDGERGADGRPGLLPIVKAWTEGVSYEGDVRTHLGSLFQAVRDTGRSPPHEDWIEIAAAGKDGRSFTVKGTYTKSAEYGALDVVAMDGSSFVAVRDNPGECPGAGWQLLSPRGKAGKPGDRGFQGPEGRPGAPGPAVKSIGVDGEGLITVKNGDGSTATCDLYPVLASIKSA